MAMSALLLQIQSMPRVIFEYFHLNIKYRLQLKPTSQKAVLDDTIEEEVEEVVPLRQSININAIGQYQNQKILEFDINNVAEQPWRRPGADITDYFNYGFNENTWKDYCMKQRELREAFPYGGAVYQQNIQKKSVFDKAMDEMGVPVRLV